MRGFSLVFIPLLLLAFLTTGGSVMAQGQGVVLPDGTLDADAVAELFVGKTVESVTAAKGRVSTSYYSPDGKLYQLRNNSKRTGSWRIRDDGRICLQMEQSREKCRIIVLENGTYKKYIVKKNGRHQHSVTYRKFMRGNPLGL